MMLLAFGCTVTIELSHWVQHTDLQLHTVRMSISQSSSLFMKTWVPRLLSILNKFKSTVRLCPCKQVITTANCKCVHKFGAPTQHHHHPTPHSCHEPILGNSRDPYLEIRALVNNNYMEPLMNSAPSPMHPSEEQAISFRPAGDYFQILGQR